MCTIATVHLVNNWFGQEIPLRQFVVYVDFLNVRYKKWTLMNEDHEQDIRRASQNTIRLSFWLEVQNSSG
jgi:hypothetical protein